MWRRLTARTLRFFAPHHLGYGDPQGMPDLRKSICNYLQAARGVQCGPERVVITAGTQRGLAEAIISRDQLFRANTDLCC